MPKSLAHLHEGANRYLYIMAELSPQDIQALVRKMQQVDYIETYMHFPEVITAGPFRLEENELSYLLKEELIEQRREDSIGKVYCFTHKFKNMFG